MAFIEWPGVEGLFHKGTSEDYLISPFKGKEVWVTLSGILSILKTSAIVTGKVVLMIDCLH